MALAVLLALILFNGLLAMAEIALVTARKARLQKWIDEGDSAAQAAARLGEDPTRFLSTIQIGITSIGVLNGMVGEAALAAPMAGLLVQAGLSDQHSHWLATGLVVVLITYFSIVVGELVPKRLAQSNPETVARVVARPIHWLAIVTKPFVILLSVSTRALLKLLGIQDHGSTAVTEEDIRTVLQEGRTAGVIESQEHTMVRNVFRLDDRQIRSLMVPRSDVVFLDLADPFEVNMARVAACDHSRFPVIRGDVNRPLGVLHARRWLTHALKGGPRELDAQALQEPLYVPESITAMALLDSFREAHESLAFVMDEYGEIQGIVSLQDLIQVITGDTGPLARMNAWARQCEDGSWLLDGHIPIPELKDCLGLKTVPDEKQGRYHTLSGMIMQLTGQLPQEGDRVKWEGWLFDILDVDGRTIDKVHAHRLLLKSWLLEQP